MKEDKNFKMSKKRSGKIEQLLRLSGDVDQLKEREFIEKYAYKRGLELSSMEDLDKVII